MNEASSESPIVRVEELARHVDDPDWIVVDCRFDLMAPDAGRLAWEDGHVPGAVYADLDRQLAAPVAPDGIGGRHPLPAPDDLERLFRSWGITEKSRVVAYDDMGNAVAARLWWLLRWAGHCRAAVLDGGMHAWLAAGHTLSNDTPAPATGSFAVRPGSMSEVDADAVAAGLAVGELSLLDGRAALRFAGEVEPIDRRAGHVPGATNTPFDANLGADKCFRAPEELQAYYRAAIGATDMNRVACMCGSGVTACHTLLALEIAGLQGAALYNGSWSDWISDDARPIATDDG
ncbi:MAG: sulfurtransferase [Gammaproteobacteria bacterium]|nr:sulfurtransferase [Gammaproteobacteria bacterium]NND37701.1 sulfurtransferase [Gammaproteobacteria bacterium]